MQQLDLQLGLDVDLVISRGLSPVNILLAVLAPVLAKDGPADEDVPQKSDPLRNYYGKASATLEFDRAMSVGVSFTLVTVIVNTFSKNRPP